MVRGLDVDDLGRTDSASPRTSYSPTNSAARDWREIAAALATNLERIFDGGEGTVGVKYTGYTAEICHSADDLMPKSILALVMPPMQRRFPDLSVMEIEAVFWKIVLNIEQAQGIYRR